MGTKTIKKQTKVIYKTVMITHDGIETKIKTQNSRSKRTSQSSPSFSVVSATFFKGAVNCFRGKQCSDCESAKEILTRRSIALKDEVSE